jgi:nucleoside-diphosphate-sugar epimerase
MTRTALVLGASGRFGRHAAAALAAEGWTIRRMRRGSDDPAAVARGVDLVVNGMNPPDYRNWAEEVPRITALALDAARASGALMIQAGNVYPLGREPAPWSAATAHRPVTEKGRIRAASEATLAAAAARGDARIAILRAGDFFETDNARSWFGLITGSAGRCRYPGDPDAAHAWAWLPDLGRAVASVGGRAAGLPAFSDIAFPGFSLTGRALSQAIGRVTGRPVRLTGFPWWMLRLAAPFWETAAGLVEMRYLWDHPHALDGADFARLCPDFRPTPLDVALRAALAGGSGRGEAVIDEQMRPVHEARLVRGEEQRRARNLLRLGDPALLGAECGL